MKKITINPGCIGCGVCQVICPEVFEVNEIASVKDGFDFEKNKEKIKEAVQTCPVKVIEVDE